MLPHSLYVTSFEGLTLCQGKRKAKLGTPGLHPQCKVSRLKQKSEAAGRDWDPNHCCDPFECCTRRCRGSSK